MILLDKENSSAVLTGTAYNVKYYGVENGKRKAPFCRLRLNYDYEQDEFGENSQLYFTCVAYGPLADYIVAVTEDAKPTLLLTGKVEDHEYNGKVEPQLIVKWVSVQPTLPAAKKKREDDFSDIDI